MTQPGYTQPDREYQAASSIYTGNPSEVPTKGTGTESHAKSTGTEKAQPDVCDLRSGHSSMKAETESDTATKSIEAAGSAAEGCRFSVFTAGNGIAAARLVFPSSNQI